MPKYWAIENCFSKNFHSNVSLFCEAIQVKSGQPLASTGKRDAVFFTYAPSILKKNTYKGKIWILGNVFKQTTNKQLSIEDE